MAERICSIDGCDRTVEARGWCSVHYRMWLRHGDPLKRTRKERGKLRFRCEAPGCDLPPNNDDRFCSMHRARLHRHGDTRGPLLVCVVCGKQFFGGRADAKACGDVACKRALWEAAEVKRRQVADECTISGCAKPSIVRGWCQAHYAKWQRYGDPLGLARLCIVCDAPFYVRHGGLQCTCGRKECTRELTRRSCDKRRALKTGAFVERVFRRKVYERDGWRCHLCGKKTRRDVRPTHPLAPSLDHVVPLSCGGTHEYTNVRCAHLRCNHAKNNRAVNEQLLML